MITRSPGFDSPGTADGLQREYLAAECGIAQYRGHDVPGDDGVDQPEPTAGAVGRVANASPRPTKLATPANSPRPDQPAGAVEAECGKSVATSILSGSSPVS